MSSVEPWGKSWVQTMLGPVLLGPHWPSSSYLHQVFGPDLSVHQGSKPIISQASLP
jgi:hypothetical protein